MFCKFYKDSFLELKFFILFLISSSELQAIKHKKLGKKNTES